MANITQDQISQWLAYPSRDRSMVNNFTVGGRRAVFDPSKGMDNNPWYYADSGEQVDPQIQQAQVAQQSGGLGAWMGDNLGPLILATAAGGALSGLGAGGAAAGAGDAVGAGAGMEAGGGLLGSAGVGAGEAGAAGAGVAGGAGAGAGGLLGSASPGAMKIAASLAGAALSGMGSSQSGTQTVTNQQQLDPRIQSMLFGDGGANQGLLSQYQALGQQPQSAGLLGYGQGSDAYLGANGAADMQGMRGAANGLMGSNIQAPMASFQNASPVTMGATPAAAMNWGFTPDAMQGAKVEQQAPMQAASAQAAPIMQGTQIARTPGMQASQVANVPGMQATLAQATPGITAPQAAQASAMQAAQVGAPQSITAASANAPAAMQAATAQAAQIAAPAQNSLNLRGAYDDFIKGNSGSNPYLDSSIQGGIDKSAGAMRAMQDDSTRNLMENILPSIRSNSILAGQYGGSRQGIAEGRALGDFGREQQRVMSQFGDNNTAAAIGAKTAAYDQGQNRALSALSSLSGNQYQAAGANAGMAQQANLANQGAEQQTAGTNYGGLLQTNLTNAGLAQGAATTNQAAGMQAASTNAGLQQGANAQNNSNNQQTNLANAGFGLSAGTTNAGLTQQTNLTNAGFTNAAAQTNQGGLLAQAAQNAQLGQGAAQTNYQGGLQTNLAQGGIDQQTGLQNNSNVQQMNLANAGFTQGANQATYGGLLAGATQNASNQQQANSTNYAGGLSNIQTNIAAANNMNQFNSGLQQQSNLAQYQGNLGANQFNANAFNTNSQNNQQAQMGTNSLNSANQLAGIGASSGLLGQSVGAATNQDNYALNRASMTNGLLQPYIGLNGSSTSSQPIYQNQGGNILGGAMAGLGLYNQFKGAFGTGGSAGQGQYGAAPAGTYYDGYGYVPFGQ